MIKIILLIMLTFVTSCKGNLPNNAVVHKTAYDLTNKKKLIVPVLNINKREFTKLQSPYFSHSVGGTVIDEKTLVAIKYDDQYLNIHFECHDNLRIDQNTYTEDNSSMFNQEVFELFISPGEAASENYWEIQLNPNNALYLGKVNNRYTTDQTFQIELISNKLAKIERQVIKDQENNVWKGQLKIPLALIQATDSKDTEVFRMNLYRIISQQDQEDPNWKNNAKNSTFACWSSTMAENPNFHKPDYFGFLYLK